MMTDSTVIVHIIEYHNLFEIAVNILQSNNDCESCDKALWVIGRTLGWTHMFLRELRARPTMLSFSESSFS